MGNWVIWFGIRLSIYFSLKSLKIACSSKVTRMFPKVNQVVDYKFIDGFTDVWEKGGFLLRPLRTE